MPRKKATEVPEMPETTEGTMPTETEGAIPPETGEAMPAGTEETITEEALPAETAEEGQEEAGPGMAFGPLALGGPEENGQAENWPDEEEPAPTPDGEASVMGKLDNADDEANNGDIGGDAEADGNAVSDAYGDKTEDASGIAGMGDDDGGKAGNEAGDDPPAENGIADAQNADDGIEAVNPGKDGDNDAPDKKGTESPTGGTPGKASFFDLKLNRLDQGLSPGQQREWNAIYASYRSKSVLTGTVVGVDEHVFSLRNRETREIEKKKMLSAVVIGYRVKVLIPEAEMWMPDENRPGHVLRNMAGCKIDYVVMDVDREGECAIASRRVALAARRHYFSTAKSGHQEGDILECNVLAVGPRRCLVECNGYDISLVQRDLSYAAIPDLREKYRPGQPLPCKLKSYGKETGLSVSVKEVNPNPFDGADLRHPIGSRRHAVISGKYGGGVFCTLPDGTVCLCLYSPQHNDGGFQAGDSVIIVIRQYDHGRKLIYGKILAKW